MLYGLSLLTWFTVTEYLCYKRQPICSVCCHHKSFPSSFMTYHGACNRCDTTGTICGAEIVNRPEHLSSSSGFSGVRVAQSLVFHVAFCMLLFILLRLLYHCIVCSSPTNGFCLLFFVSSSFSNSDISIKIYVASQRLDSFLYACGEIVMHLFCSYAM